MYSASSRVSAAGRAANCFPALFTSQSLEAPQFPFAVVVAEELERLSRETPLCVLKPPASGGDVTLPDADWGGACSTPLTLFHLPWPFLPPSSPLGPEASHNAPLPPRASTVRSRVVLRVHGPR